MGVEKVPMCFKGVICDFLKATMDKIYKYKFL